jgi:acetyl-CoA synthetase
MSQWLEGPGAVEAERLEHVSVFRSLDSCMAALRAWARGGD